MENKTRPAELLPSTTTRGAGCAPKDPLWEMFPIFSNIQNLRNWRYLRALSIYSPADGAEEQQVQYLYKVCVIGAQRIVSVDGGERNPR